MPLPFHPDDFPLDQKAQVKPTKVFYLKGAIHFSKDAQILDLSDDIQASFDNFSGQFVGDVMRAVKEAEDDDPAYVLHSTGDMMRTIKTLTDGSGSKLCQLSTTFVSFASSMLRFPKDSEHSRGDVEMSPVDGDGSKRHEAFVVKSCPYFWDMTGENDVHGVLYKGAMMKRVPIAKVAPLGTGKDAILVLDGRELDEVVAVASCVVLLQGRDAIHK